jgi:hypothetical protein
MGNRSRIRIRFYTSKVANSSLAEAGERSAKWKPLSRMQSDSLIVGGMSHVGTKWEQDWQYQPNAAKLYVRQGSIVTALQSKPLSITATCFQYHEFGRRTGLKIRSSQERVWVEVPPSVLSARRESAGRSLRLGRPYHPPFECDPRLLNRIVVKHRTHQFGGRMEPSTRSSGRLPAPCGPWV